MIYTHTFHVPVLFPQVIKFLKIGFGQIYVDATLGGGGYAFEILKRGGVVLGIDADREAIEYVKNKLRADSLKWKVDKDIFLEQGNFASIKKIVDQFGFRKVHGIIFDLGLSSYQLDKSGRGFSYRKDEPLDMRMDLGCENTAADILNNYQEEELYEIFSKYSEELNSRAIAKAISRARSLRGKFKKTSDLTSVIYEPAESKSKQIKVLSRIFQALRIEVNKELANLKTGLKGAVPLLAKGGKLCVLSYHSLEDRIVKTKLKQEQVKGKLKIITKKPITPDREEIKKNPRARSAKLRVGEKL